MFDFNDVFGSVTCQSGYQNNLGLSEGEVYNLKHIFKIVEVTNFLGPYSKL